MSQKIYPVPDNFAAAANIKRTDYQRMYAQSVNDPDRFWADIGQRIDWIQQFSLVKDASFAEADFRIRWFNDGKLNVSRNCLDRHLESRGDKTAISLGRRRSERRRIHQLPRSSTNVSVSVRTR